MYVYEPFGLVFLVSGLGFGTLIWYFGLVFWLESAFTIADV